MKFVKVGQAVYVGNRKVEKDGKTLEFFDLHMFFPDEGTCVLPLPENLAPHAAALVGQHVALEVELLPDRKAPYLYRLQLRAIRAYERAAARNAG